MRATVYYNSFAGMTDAHLPRYVDRQVSTEVQVDADGDLVVVLPGVVRQEVEESGLGTITLRLPRPIIAELEARKR
jgi:hypothetical protein